MRFTWIFRIAMGFESVGLETYMDLSLADANTCKSGGFALNSNTSYTY